MHLSRPISDGEHGHTHPHLGERSITRCAERAMQANRTIDNVVIHTSHCNFAHTDMGTRRTVGLVVNDPGSLQYEQSELLELYGGVGNHSFHELVVGKQATLSPA